jgi:hypothetical protein
MVDLFGSYLLTFLSDLISDVFPDFFLPNMEINTVPLQNMVIIVQGSFPHRRFKLTSTGLGVRPSDKWLDASSESQQASLHSSLQYQFRTEVLRSIVCICVGQVSLPVTCHAACIAQPQPARQCAICQV